MATRASHGPPFRAEHLGSLLRPQDLLAKRQDVDDGKATEKDLAPLEDSSIKTIVNQQLELGFHAVTDGEYRSVSLPIHLVIISNNPHVLHQRPSIPN